MSAPRALTQWLTRRREASRRAKITSVPNPYEVVAAETSVVSASKAIPVSRPEEAWRESFVRNFAAARKVSPSLRNERISVPASLS